MELKDGKIVVSEEEKKLMGSNEWKAFAEENKLIVEKKVEVEKPLTDEIVTGYISKNQALSDRLFNDNAVKFLKNKLKKDVTVDDLGKEIILKDELENLKKSAIKSAVTLGLNSVSKHSNLLINAVDFGKLDIQDGKLTGYDEELTKLKTDYPDLFAIKQTQTPPAFPTNKDTKLTLEAFEKMTSSEKSKLSDEEVNNLLKI